MSELDLPKICKSSKIPTCTLDLDYNDFERVGKVISKIRKCAFNVRVEATPSDLKGFHLKVFCAYRQCDICRLVFDDINRFYFDQFRPLESQGVLAHIKSIIPAHKISSQKPVCQPLERRQ